MSANHTLIAPGVVKGGGAAASGLVPYTTTHTGRGNRTWDASDFPKPTTVLERLAMPTFSARQNRLVRMKHHVRTASRLIKETMSRNGRKWRALFVTLTYRPGVSWQSNHMTLFFTNVRNWANRQGAALGYVWVAEMQRRGAVHYHAVVWLPASLRLPRPDKRGWWRHGSTNVQAVKRNATGYLMKYVSKGVRGDDPDLPAGARMCGSGGLDAMARDEFHYWRLPRYVRQNVTIGERCRRVKGGGWASTVSGEVWRSDWGLYGIAYRPMDPDCNGRPRRADAIIMLSDTYKRQSCVMRMDPAVVERVHEIQREEAWDLVMSGSIAGVFRDAA